MAAILNIRSAKKNITFVEVHTRTIHAMFALNWFTGFRGQKFLNIFPIGSYVKTMSADGGHLEYPIGKKNITFVAVHTRTIPAMFALNWFTGFRGENFKKFFP